MGVTCVVPWNVPEGMSSQQAMDMIQKKVELLGATKTGNWSVDCETYQSAPNLGSKPKLMHLVHSTEYPFSSFAAVEGGTCLISDAGFDILVARLKGFYNPRKSAKIEAKGQRYEYGDFIIKVGHISGGPAFKGVVVETEYIPCCDTLQCWSLLTEFLQGLLGPNVTVSSAPKMVLDKREGLFTPAETILQYVDLFNNSKKTQP